MGANQSSEAWEGVATSNQSAPPAAADWPEAGSGASLPSMDRIRFIN
jgi:hypothetical protein